MDETETKPRTKVLKNGAVYDLDKKKIVANPGGGNAAFNSETALEAVRRKQEIKQQRLLAGAAKVLERSGAWETPNDMDVVEAIGEAAMVKALTVEDPKQIDAARFVLTEAGLSVKQAYEQAGPSNDAAGILTAAAQLFRLLADTPGRAPAPEIVDGTVTDTRKD